MVEIKITSSICFGKTENLVRKKLLQTEEIKHVKRRNFVDKL